MYGYEQIHSTWPFLWPAARTARSGVIVIAGVNGQSCGTVGRRGDSSSVLRMVAWCGHCGTAYVGGWRIAIVGSTVVLCNSNFVSPRPPNRSGHSDFHCRNKIPTSYIDQLPLLLCASRATCEQPRHRFVLYLAHFTGLVLASPPTFLILLAGLACFSSAVCVRGLLRVRQGGWGRDSTLGWSFCVHSWEEDACRAATRQRRGI